MLDVQKHDRAFLKRHRYREMGRPWSWGWVIYRTVYTEESDEIWDSVISKLTEYIYREVDNALWFWPPYRVQSSLPPSDSSPNDEIREHLKNLIMSDKSLYDGLSINGVRQKFNEYVLAQQVMIDLKGDMCLMIDEEALHSIHNAAPPTRTEEDFEKYLEVHPIIKVVNRYPSIPEVTRTEAWMRASLNSLYSLWTEEMERVFPYYDEETGERSVYEGQPQGMKENSKQPKPDIGSDPSGPTNINYGARRDEMLICRVLN